MEFTKLKSINEYTSTSINPMKEPSSLFEVYSVPIYDTGHPEYLHGSEIGSNKVIVEKDDILLCKINPRINRVWIVMDESEYQRHQTPPEFALRARHRWHEPAKDAYCHQRAHEHPEVCKSRICGCAGNDSPLPREWHR